MSFQNRHVLVWKELLVFSVINSLTLVPLLSSDTINAASASVIECLTLDYWGQSKPRIAQSCVLLT